jgi:excinuclease ABC subunit A
VLHRLVDAGNTVVLIEHNLDVIAEADWIVDMGPEGGSRGGLVVAEGTPEDVAANPESFTGAFLKPLLDGREAKQPTRKKAAATAPAAKSPGRKTATKTTAKKTATRRTARKSA